MGEKSSKPSRAESIKQMLLSLHDESDAELHIHIVQIVPIFFNGTWEEPVRIAVAETLCENYHRFPQENELPLLELMASDPCPTVRAFTAFLLFLERDSHNAIFERLLADPVESVAEAARFVRGFAPA